MKTVSIKQLNVRFQRNVLYTEGRGSGGWKESIQLCTDMCFACIIFVTGKCKIACNM